MEVELLSEIPLGATQALDDQRPLVSFARLTEAAGRKFSLPIGIVEKYSRGKRIYRSGPARFPGTIQPTRAVGVANRF
ncbi:hypothetical protein FSB08_26285 [Paraburkholderia sp. JPY432]|uniref:hypothetical protein n=1 Tax=Paraburkholderia youngii TaxID=2782701 RepID=UPI001C3C3847|nr:hypothetical protein [Paraburkholderia youngii]NVH75946.1 hypothetical protein [Paraburkholderia youngii]